MSEPCEWTRMDDGFIGLVGPIYSLPHKNGLQRFRFTAEEKHRNRRGIVHGGMLMTFADRSLGTAARQGDMDRPQATVQLDVHFMRPACVGDTVELECRVVRETNSLVFVDGTMSAQGETIATASGVWKKIGKRDEAESGSD